MFWSHQRKSNGYGSRQLYHRTPSHLVSLAQTQGLGELQFKAMSLPSSKPPQLKSGWSSLSSGDLRWGKVREEREDTQLLGPHCWTGQALQQPLHMGKEYLQRSLAVSPTGQLHGRTTGVPKPQALYLKSRHDSSAWVNGLGTHTRVGVTKIQQC